MITEWPVFDPGSAGIADLYPYELEYLDQAASVQDDLGEEEPTAIIPSAWLVERCQTSAALRFAK